MELKQRIGIVTPYVQQYAYFLSHEQKLNSPQVIVLMPLVSRNELLLEPVRDGRVHINDWMTGLINHTRTNVEDEFAKEDVRMLAYTLICKLPPRTF